LRLKCFSKGEDGTQCSINAHCLIGGTSVLLSPLVGQGAAREIVLLADNFEAAVAQRLGLLHRLVEPERLDTEVLALTDKRLLNRLLEAELERAFQGG
jgi:enoyl-CoA hydratase/carnithine racemase